jgi:predicted lipoprotein with Yx(FWY)xxD motif
MIRKLLLLPAIAVALSACSNGSTTTTAPAAGGTSSSSPSGATSGETVQTTNNGDFGTILTDADGHTLYLFEQDQGTTTDCTTGCSSTWPALTAGKPTAGDGVDASLLGTAKQADGTVQVTYNGHLVYRYSGDAAAGDTNGEGISGVWFVVSAAGEPVQQAGGGGSASSSGGYVYR